jgi:hypothetical protein
MSLHSGTLFWFRANQSLLFLLNVASLIFFIFYTVNVDLFHISSIWVQLKSHLWRWSEVCTTTRYTSCVCAHDHSRDFRTGPVPVTSSHVTDVTSAEKVSLRQILCNVRLRMRMTFFRFRTGPLPVTQLVYLVVVQVAWLPLTEGNPKVWKGVRMPNWKLLNISLVGPFHHPHRHHHHRHHHHHHHHHHCGGGWSTSSSKPLN